MDFEVYCFNYMQGCVRKEYFNTYKQACDFQFNEQDNYDCVSITPMNENAEHEMACVQCGGKYGQEACNICRHK